MSDLPSLLSNLALSDKAPAAATPPRGLLTAAEKAEVAAAWDVLERWREMNKKNKKSKNKNKAGASAEAKSAEAKQAAEEKKARSTLKRLLQTAERRFSTSKLDALNFFEAMFGLSPSPSITEAKAALAKVHIHILDLLMERYDLRCPSFSALHVRVQKMGPYPRKNAKAQGVGVFLRVLGTRTPYAA